MCQRMHQCSRMIQKEVHCAGVQKRSVLSRVYQRAEESMPEFIAVSIPRMD